MALNQMTLVACFSGLLLAGCGMYPFSMQKDLQNADNEQKSTEQQNQNLQQQNQTESSYLQNIYTSDNYTWIWTGAFVPTYAQANATCTAVGYQLPSQAALNEFISELYNNKPQWQAAVKQQQIYVSGVTTDIPNGFSVCERAKN
jgi:hypothetical protein